MKEKRYFCDYWYGTQFNRAIPFLIVILSFIVITPISSIITYNMLLSEYENELNSYSESTYQYLDEIADSVIQDGVGINLLALPDDVVKYTITSNRDEIIFEYYFDNNKDSFFADSASMTVKLSNNYKIISKEPNFSSEENYINSIKIGMTVLSILRGFLTWIFSILLGIMICTIISVISMYTKNKNLS